MDSIQNSCRGESYPNGDDDADWGFGLPVQPFKPELKFPAAVKARITTLGRDIEPAEYALVFLFCPYLFLPSVVTTPRFSC